MNNPLTCCDQIRDIETDEPRGPGEVGEVVVKGPMIMLGYSNNEEANKTTFDAEGWMRSGDIGYYDQDGFLYIVDRMKELIKVKGLQVLKFGAMQFFSRLSLGCSGRA